MTTAEMTNLNVDDNDSGDLKNQRQLDDTIIMGDSVWKRKKKNENCISKIQKFDKL